MFKHHQPSGNTLASYMLYFLLLLLTFNHSSLCADNSAYLNLPSICSHESCINTRVFSISESKRDLPDVAVLPAAENTLSDDADVAGIHKIRLASALSKTNLFYY